MAVLMLEHEYQLFLCSFCILAKRIPALFEISSDDLFLTQGRHRASLHTFQLPSRYSPEEYMKYMEFSASIRDSLTTKCSPINRRSFQIISDRLQWKLTEIVIRKFQIETIERHWKASRNSTMSLQWRICLSKLASRIYVSNWAWSSIEVNLY